MSGPSEVPKQQRRGRGEGAIEQRPDGTWMATVSLGVVAGKRIRKWVYGSRKADVVEKMRRVQADFAAGLAEPSKGLLKDYLTGWLASRTIRKNTYSAYARAINKNIVPHIGDVKLADLRSEHVAALLKTLAATGREAKDGTKHPLGSRTIQIARQVLTTSLSEAVERDLIRRSPMVGVSLVEHRTEEREVWSREQVATYLTAVASHRYAPLFAFALYTGLREGELLGLQWADIDFREGVVHVRRQLLEVDSAVVGLAELKTEAGRRSFALPGVATAALMARREQALAEGLASCPTVFPNRVGGFTHKRTLLKIHYAFVNRAGLPRITIHDLRHTAATLMLQAGVPMGLVSRRLGHKSITITMDRYAHVTDAMDRTASDRVDEMFGRMNPPTRSHK